MGQVVVAGRFKPDIYTTSVVSYDVFPGTQTRAVALVLDVDLLQPGTVTVELRADDVLRHTLTYETVGAHGPVSFPLPPEVEGEWLEIRITSTAAYRLCPGTVLRYTMQGVPGEQHVRLTDAPFGQGAARPHLQTLVPRRLDHA